MDDYGDLVQPEIVERSAIESIERASVDIQIATAQKYKKHLPEMMSQVKARMITLATIDEETAASCFYTLPRGGKTIQGESVRLAEIAFSCYGNARVQARIIEVVSDGPEPHVVIQAISHDLEQNVAYSAEKRRRITKKKSKNTVDEDDIQLAVNACTAIAFRDAIFKMIPKAFIRPVMLAAKKVAIGDVKSLGSKRQTVVERLKAMGATQERILSVVSCLKIEDIGMEQLETLIGLGTALKEGDISLEEAFPAIVEVEPGVEGLKNRIENKKGKITSKKADKNAEKTPPTIDEPGETDENPETDEPEGEQSEDLAGNTQQPAGQDTKVPPEERYYCPKCEGVFPDAKGKTKTICPNNNCLSIGVIDRWKQ